MVTGEPRVLVDATAVPADRGGVGRYVESLVAALHADGADLAVVCQPRDVAGFSAMAPQARVVDAGARVATRPGRLSWEQTTLPRLARHLGATVLHSPHYTTPLADSGAATVVTLHDATFFTECAAHSPVKARFFRGWTRASLRRAHACVVPSRATVRELVAVAGADPGRLHVVPHGVDPAAFHPASDAEVAEVRAALGLGAAPYLAFLGALEPRKNVPALLRGYTRATHGRVEPPALVLAGAPGWDRQVERALASVPHRLRVLRAGYLPFGMLAGFLGGAQLVVYPSLGEGFGLPVLEAMACGAAVLTSDRRSLPEVGGDAVAYCETTAESIAAGLTTLLDDTVRRKTLADAALDRAAGFTWQRSARLHRETYAQAVHLARHRR